MNGGTGSGVRWLARGWLVLVCVVLGERLVLAQAAPVAVVEPLQGLVQWHDHGHDLGADDDAWETLAARQLVAESDRLRTGSNGLAVITFFDGVEAAVLPGSVVVVSELAAGSADTPQQVTLDLLVGELFSAVHAAADPGVRYQVNTPVASAVVRGTRFFVHVTPAGETVVSVDEGTVEVTGRDFSGEPTQTTPVEAGFTVEVAADGTLGPLVPRVLMPDYPADAALVPLTCGDGRCEPAEEETCAADCGSLPACGDHECDLRGGEDPITCPADCAPGERTGLKDESVLHFFWAEGRCDYMPDAEHMVSPVTLIWGVGCFDSSAHASAHPFPADYQLTINGQTADMSSLRQSGPDAHDPYCPWGWSFELGPLMLDAGAHQLTLTETITDTWSGQSGVRLAGEQATLVCDLHIEP